MTLKIGFLAFIFAQFAVLIPSDRKILEVLAGGCDAVRMDKNRFVSPGQHDSVVEPLPMTQEVAGEFLVKGTRRDCRL